jgi:hypothetical protein
MRRNFEQRIGKLEASTQGPKYQKNILDALKGFFLWLKDDRMISDVPKFVSVDVPEYSFQVISRETQLEILSKIPQNISRYSPFFLTRA